MNRGGRRDYVAIALATAGVLAALSLAGIFIVYLIDEIGGDDEPATAQVVGATAPTVPGGTVPGGSITPGTTAPGTTAPGGGGGGAGAGAGAQGGAGGQASGGNRIPDNQQYETFTNRSAKWSILYPQGWDASKEGDRQRWGRGLNAENVLVVKGAKPSVASVRTQLGRQKLKLINPPQEVKVGSNSAIKATFVRSQKRAAGGVATIFTNYYAMWNGGRTATIALACPFGVSKPNADDYDRIIESFRWL